MKRFIIISIIFVMIVLSSFKTYDYKQQLTTPCCECKNPNKSHWL